MKKLLRKRQSTKALAVLNTLAGVNQEKVSDLKNLKIIPLDVKIKISIKTFSAKIKTRIIHQQSMKFG